jgi:hypothetical protein
MLKHYQENSGKIVQANGGGEVGNRVVVIEKSLCASSKNPLIPTERLHSLNIAFEAFMEVVQRDTIWPTSKLNIRNCVESLLEKYIRFV